MKGFMGNIMNDLVFVLNAKETKKSGIIIFETYLCNNKTNAKKKYSGGLIRKTSIFDQIDVKNFSNSEIVSIRRWFANKVFSISSYQYLTDLESFCFLIDMYASKNNFYFHTYKQDMFAVCEYLYCKEYKQKRNDVFCPIDGFDLIYDKRNACICIVENESKIKNITNIDPKAKVIINDDEYKLFFNYDRIEIPYDTRDFIFEYDSKIIVRKFDIEQTLEQKFLELGFQKKKENVYKCKKNINVQTLLDENGFLIEYEDSKQITKGKIHVDIKKSSYDWFDLNVFYDFDDKTVELSGLIDLFSNKTTVLVDNQRIDLPKSITENAEKIIRDENGLKIPVSNVWTMLQIANENNVDVFDFISYKDIEICFDKKIEQKILDYQREGAKWLKWLFKNKIGGCLADDMGVGKTFQTIAFLSDHLMKDSLKKILIIVPYVLMTNWIREFDKFSNENSIFIYHGDGRKNVLKQDNRVIITTYATASSDIEILNTIRFDVVIFDEIQYIKNNTSKTYDTLSRLDARTRIGLSGTPLENRIDELWNILNILNPGMMVNKCKFMKKYRKGNYDELHKVLNPFILRRTKEEVIDQLPEKSEEIIYCDFSTEQRQLYDAIKLAVKESMKNYSSVNNTSMLKGLLLLRQVCCHPRLLNEEVNVNGIEESCKFDALKIKVSEIVESGNKVVIFSQFTKMLQIIKRWCEEEKLKHFYLDGKTSKRQEEIDNFEKSEDGIFLISLKVGGVGLNLTSAHYAIIYDPWWNPFAEQQAEDRIFRIGQKHNVTIFKMIVSETIEEKILNMQISKQQLFSDIMNGISTEKIDLQELIAML